jgi:hypothetical protein
MSTSAVDERIKEVRTTDDELIVAFVDGRTLSVPLVWYPRLLHASAEQRRDWRLIADGEGVHWPQIDEDLSAAGMLRGVPAATSKPYPAAASKEIRNQAVQTALDFYGDSLGTLKAKLQGARAMLESVMEQLPGEEAKVQAQEFVDSYLAVEYEVDRAARDLGVEDAVNQAAQRAQEAVGQVAQQAQDTAGQVANQAGQVAQGMQEATGQAVGQTVQAVESLVPRTQVLGQTTNKSGQIVQRAVDESGKIIETTLDESGNVVDEDIVGSVADLPVEEEDRASRST